MLRSGRRLKTGPARRDPDVLFCIFLAKCGPTRSNRIRAGGTLRRVPRCASVFASGEIWPAMHERALELFREACGLGAPIALECEGPSNSADWSAGRTFDCPFVLIGRDRRSGLFLDDGQVGRRHALLQAVDGQVFVLDLQSRSKVFWEGEEAARPHGWLAESCSIMVGPYRIRRSGSGALVDCPHDLDVFNSPLQANASNEDSVPRAALELPIRMGDGPSLWRLESRLALAGRSAICQFVLTDASVSRFHAAFVRTPLGVWVIDMVAREGTYVNGKRVSWAWLSDGDSLRIGSFTFILRYETPPERISRHDVPLKSGAIPDAQSPTQLAVRTRSPDSNGSALAVPDRSQRGLRTVSAAKTITPATLIPHGGDSWEQPLAHPQQAMAMWQQQMRMMESFHNDMIMMVQMFFAMHREHLASAREELERVEQLTRELSALQARLREPTESPGAGPAAGVDRAPKRLPPLDAVDRQTRAVAGESNQAAHRRESGSPKSGSPKSGIKSSKRKSPPKSDGASEIDGAQLHAQLTKRITELQRERQGYWQSIMSKMSK
jgi:pSer/pThr/pTyr-binding forkhead associated (FHA) protein